MSNSRAGRTCPLIEVPRVLVQQRWQYGAADHDVRETIRGSCTNPLTVRVPALSIIQTVPCLSGGRNYADTNSGSRIGSDLEGKREFHLASEGRRIGFIGNIEVRNNPKHALFFLDLELLSRHLHWIVSDLDLRKRRCNPKLNVGDDFGLAWFERNAGQCPVRKILGTDADLVGNSWLEVVKLEKSVFGRYNRAAIIAISSLEKNGRVGDRIAVYIRNGTDNAAHFQFCCLHALCGQARRNC